MTLYQKNVLPAIAENIFFTADEVHAEKSVVRADFFTSENFLPIIFSSKEVFIMNVKIGNSYVSDAAANFAKNSSDDDKNILKNLREKFPNLKISVGTSPFSGTGTNNLSISPKILKEMKNNPDKKIEYEALIYDIASQNVSSPNLKSHGFIITDDGGLRGWGISQRDNKKNKNSWLESLLPKKNPAAKAEKNQNVRVKIDSEGNMTVESSKTTVTFNESKRARQLAAAQTVEDIQSLLNLLQNDLNECEEGLRNNFCDEDEVKKVKKMIERAKEKFAEIKKNPPAKNFSVDVLI